MRNTIDDEPDDEGVWPEVPVWPEVLERFRGAYGCEPDFEDATDRYLLIQLLEEAVHAKIARKLVVMFREATKRIEHSTDRLFSEERP
jgi:hypothetical protein